MKIVFTAVALLGFASFGAQAAEDFPVGVSRSVTAEIPSGDVGSEGYPSTTAGSIVTMHNSGVTAATAIDAFPKFRPNQPAVATASAQHHS